MTDNLHPAKQSANRGRMLLDSLKNHARYAFLGPQFTRAFEFLSQVDPSIADGRVELEGDDYANIQSYTTEPKSDRRFEAHEKYIDIQYMLSGSEQIYYQEADSLVVKTPYDDERDVAFYEETPGKPIALNAGEFIIFWPQDGHQPCCILDQAEAVRKIVVKIRIQE